MPSPTRPDWPHRLAALRARLAIEDLDGLIVSSPANIRYLTGFSGSAGVLVVTAREEVLVVDGRYVGSTRAAQARGDLAPVRLERVTTRYDVTLADEVRRLALPRVGFEAATVTVATCSRWEQGSGQSLVKTEGLVETLRTIKDAVELATLRRAAAKLSDVASQVRALLEIGQSERDVAGIIEDWLRRAGFDKPAFDTIVAAGPNGAYPHARPTDRRIQPGDLVVLDFGGVLDGYCVDLTRAACAAPVGAAAQSLYDAVRSAQQAAMETVRAGVAVRDVDGAARGVLEACGRGSAFLHGTGQGLGLEIHEAPYLARSEPETTRLECGMVATIEPGAYVEGLGGVRLEDDVLVTPDGAEVLTTAPRDLWVV